MRVERVVLDTNVLISAILSPLGIPILSPAAFVFALERRDLPPD
jgi:predicted nucleic acid-binding protein